MDVLITKADRTLSVPDLDYTKMAKHTGLTPAMVEYVWHNGFKQSLNDANSVVKGDDPEAAAKAWALSTKKLDAILNGSARIAGERTRDEVKAEAIRLAMDAVRDRIKAERKRVDSKYFGQPMPAEKVIREKALPYVEAFRARAEEIVAARGPKVEVELDI